MTFLLAAVVTAQLQFIVRTCDASGVSPREMETARATAGAIFMAAGIVPLWRECSETTRDEPRAIREVVVRIVKSSTCRAARGACWAGSLGFSVIDVSAGAGTLATIYVDRVRALAARAAADPGTLEGRAIAHEIGHLLLGSSSHSRAGLMRSAWEAGEIQRNLPSDWVFGDNEAETLRRRLVAPAAPGALPDEAIVAEVRAAGRFSARRSARWSTAP